VVDFEALRTRFPVLRERGYFATPCLGPFPEEMLADLEEYKRTLFLRNRALEIWIERIQELVGLVEQLLSAPQGSIALRDSATACQAAIAATLTPTPTRNRILIAPDADFHSSRYLWAAQARRGFTIVEVRAEPGQSLAEAFVEATDSRTAVVAMPWVSPRTGALLSVADIAAEARRAGALSVLDAYQGVGVVPLDVRALGVDIVVGGVHKWLYGGGMGLTFMYVRPGWMAEPVYPGWIGHAALTGCEPTYRPAPGAQRFQQGTPAIEPVYTARAGLRFVHEVGVPAIRSRSLLLTARLIAGADRAGLRVVTPRDDADRGGMVCVDVSDPDRAVEALRARGFDVDTRPGAGLRIGPSPCSNEVECDELMAALGRHCATASDLSPAIRHASHINHSPRHSRHEDQTMTTETLTPRQQAMQATFQQHTMAEFTGDLETAMATMSADPHVFHVPVMTGGQGRAAVREFYANHLVGKFLPPGAEMVTLSQTFGVDQLVSESIVRFNHSMVLDYMLPGVAPTNRAVEVALVVIIKFDSENKIAHEHIYWDQASVLVQIGLLDPKGLPVKSADAAQRLLALTKP
jgi:kynureninase